MKYKAQFFNGWKGTWMFEAADDVKAWEKARDMIDRHTQVVSVGIYSIYELDDSDTSVRRLPEYADCDKTAVKKERKKAEKQERIGIYKVYFSDGECSGPYVAEISENDVIALELAERHLKHHVEYNGLDIMKTKIIKVEELNENKRFTTNLNNKKENRVLPITPSG
jgi:hypothetical protein